MTEWKNEKFELRGINHLALVCKDMKRTVDFYTNVLGMPLIKTIDLPNGAGQHFFFDIGGGDALAFFWFPDSDDSVPGVTCLAPYDCRQSGSSFSLDTSTRCARTSIVWSPCPTVACPGSVVHESSARLVFLSF